MRTGFWLLGALCLSLAACPGCPPGPPDNDGGEDGGDDGGEDAGCVNGFCTFTLDTSPMALIADYTPQIAAALGPNDRIGVVYYKQDSGTAPDGGPDTSWGVQYLEWQGGSVTVQPEVVATVHNAYGLSVAFQTNGQPAVAYLGGPLDLAVSTSWWNNDATTSYRTGTNAWTEHIAVMASNEAPGSNGPSNSGYLVGIYPAIAFDSTNKAYLAYRDCHNGQSVGTGDYNASDLELAEGGPTAWTHTMLVEGGNDKLAWGGHNKMIMVGDQPAMVMDRVVGVPSGPGTDVHFLRRDAGSGSPSWSRSIVSTAGDTSSGPSVAYDGTKFGVAFSDRLAVGGQALYISESTRTPDGGVAFPSRDVIVQNGSGGWYPSLAYAPGTGFPNVVYHVCSVRSGVAQLFSCPAAEDELQISERGANGYWGPITVDTAGGLQPQLFFLSTGKRVVLYRDPRLGTVRIAVEQ